MNISNIPGATSPGPYRVHSNLLPGISGLSNEVINYYLLSLAVADLLCGLFVVPLSVYPAITGRWMFGDLMCRLAGYVEVTLWSVSVYTFMWISVDRYLAVRKPLRYETVSATVVIIFYIFPN